MKLNWGTGVVIAFILFISFIMYFVIAMNTDKNLDHDLVNDNYYKQELEYQNDINKEKKSKELDSKITWKKTPEGMLISFPSELDFSNIKGKVFLFCINVNYSAHIWFIRKFSLRWYVWSYCFYAACR